MPSTVCLPRRAISSHFVRKLINERTVLYKTIRIDSELAFSVNSEIRTGAVGLNSLYIKPITLESTACK